MSLKAHVSERLVPGCLQSCRTSRRCSFPGGSPSLWSRIFRECGLTAHLWGLLQPLPTSCLVSLLPVFQLPASAAMPLQTLTSNPVEPTISQTKLCFSPVSCFWPWCFITAVEIKPLNLHLPSQGVDFMSGLHFVYVWLEKYYFVGLTLFLPFHELQRSNSGDQACVASVFTS